MTQPTPVARDENADEKSSSPPDVGITPQTPLQSGVEKLATRAGAGAGGGGLVEMLAMTASMGGNPLHQKMNAEHVTQVLTLAEKHDEREFELSKRQQDQEQSDSKWDRSLHAVYFIIVIALIVFVISTFHEQPAVLTPILSGIGGGAAGFLGGVGYARKSQK